MNYCLNLRRLYHSQLHWHAPTPWQTFIQLFLHLCCASNHDIYDYSMKWQVWSTINQCLYILWPDWWDISLMTHLSVTPHANWKPLLLGSCLKILKEVLKDWSVLQIPEGIYSSYVFLAKIIMSNNLQYYSLITRWGHRLVIFVVFRPMRVRGYLSVEYNRMVRKYPSSTMVW